MLQEIREESFSGHLPHPDHWDRYGPEWHERIVRMAEAPTTDESARRDRLVNAEVAEAPKSRRAAFALVALCLIAALIAEGAFDSTVLACAFVALPVMKVASDLIPARRQKGTEDEASA